METRSASLLALALVSTFVALGAFEVGVRALGIEVRSSPSWTHHPVLGWTHVPRRRRVHHVEGRSFLVEFNALGFRDVDHALEKPPGTRRVVVIGDSFTEALQVELEETFFRRLRARLDEGSDDRWEVINLGVGDFGTAQALLALEHYGLAYQPDVVVVQIFPLNDICNNSLLMAGLCKSHMDGQRPYYVEEGGSYVWATTQPKRNWLRRNAMSFRLVEGNLRWLRNRVRPGEGLEPDAAKLRRLGFSSLDPVLHAYVPAELAPDAVAAAWRVTERLLREIVERCRESAVPVVALLTPFEARLGDRWLQFIGDQPSPPMQRDYADERLSRLLDAMDVPVIALRPLLERQLETAGRYVDGHFGPGAHEVAAEAVHTRLRELGVLAPAPGAARRPASRSGSVSR